MNDFFYNLRKAKNRMKRKFQEPSDEEFGESTEYSSSFKIIMISLLGVIALALVFIVLLLTNVINIGEQSPGETSLDASNITPEVVTVLVTPEPTEEVTATPAPTATPRATLVPGPTAVRVGRSTPVPLEETDKVVEVGWIDADLLNVRTGPSENYSRIGQLPRYSVVEVLEKERWLKIKFMGGVGYCTNTYYIPGYLPSDKYDSVPTMPPDTDATRQVQPDYSHVSEDIKIFIDKVEEEDRQYFVADIYCDASRINTLLASDTLDRTIRMTTSQMYELADDAIFAINGDFISYHNQGIAIRNGEIYRDEGGYEMLVLYSDGEMMGLEPDKITAQELIDDGAVQCWSYGPVLVQNYIADDDFTSRSSVIGHNPRTGIGMVDKGHYIIIVADGHREEYQGPTLAEFAKWFEEYGCKVAYNLEGGGASTMIFKGKVLNSPSGVEQKVTGDIIYIK